MIIEVKKLEEVHPGSKFSEPHMRACTLGHAGLDYLKASLLVVETSNHIEPLCNFLLPTMHQTLELLSKAITFKVDTTFDPKKYSHRVCDLLKDYSGVVPIFSIMLSDKKTLDLLENLEKSYLGVRYGECYVSYDGEAWRLFRQRAEELLDDLYARTQVKFLPKHFT